MVSELSLLTAVKRSSKVHTYILLDLDQEICQDGPASGSMHDESWHVLGSLWPSVYITQEHGHIHTLHHGSFARHLPPGTEHSQGTCQLQSPCWHINPAGSAPVERFGSTTGAWRTYSVLTFHIGQ